MIEKFVEFVEEFSCTVEELVGIGKLVVGNSLEIAVGLKEKLKSIKRLQ